MKTSNIRFKMLFPLLITFLLLSVVQVYSESETANEEWLRDTREAIKTTEHLFYLSVKQQAEAIKPILTSYLREISSQNLTDPGTQEQLKHVTTDIFRTLRQEAGISEFTVISNQRVVLYRAHQPEKSGDMANQRSLLVTDWSGRLTWGLEVAADGCLLLKVVVPIRNGSKKHGYIEIGKPIDQILSVIRESMKTDLLVLVNKTNIQKEQWELKSRAKKRGADWESFHTEALIHTTLSRVPRELIDIANSDLGFSFYPDPIRFGGRKFYLGSMDIVDSKDSVVGRLIQLSDMTDRMKDSQSRLLLLLTLRLTLFLVLVVITYIFALRMEKGVERKREKIIRDSEENERIQKKHLIELRNLNAKLEFQMKERQRAEGDRESLIGLLVDSNDNLEEVNLKLGNQNMKMKAQMSEIELATKEKNQLRMRIYKAEKMESLGVLAGGVAHDFNNLLVGILGNAGLVRMDLTKDSPILESINEIEDAATMASELAKQMLAYSGKGQFLVQSINLSTFVEGFKEEIYTMIPKNIRIRFQLPKMLPVIKGDEIQVRQALKNTLTNAIEAIKDDVGLITVSTRVRYFDSMAVHSSTSDASLVEGDYSIIEVADTGEGMDKETQAKLFDPFFTTKFTGRGLGMAAAYGIVRGHNGTISIESTKGTGTRIQLMFPVFTDDMGDVPEDEDSPFMPS